MHANKLHFIFLIIYSVLFFPSCIKYYKIAKPETNQGKNLPDPHKVVFDNERDVAVYDQFQTRAIFNVLRLSEAIRKAYVDMNVLKNGKDEQTKQALLRRQLEENKHWMSFYVLADIKDKRNVSLNDKNSLWSLFLQLKDGEKVRPISIKEVELEPEYQSMFDYRFNLFKRTYEVKFPVVDLTGNHFSKNGDDYELVFSSSKKSCEVNWGKKLGLYKQGMRKYKDEDYDRI
ncbi:hypothetical protein ACFLYH_02665 [Candidatus Dependentiae bacterium]